MVCLKKDTVSKTSICTKDGQVRLTGCVPPLPANAARGGFCDSSQGWSSAMPGMVGQLQRGAVTSSAGASEEALAPSNPTIYVDTMQPHILKGYNATVHNPQCGVDASCQEGNPPSPELTFLSGGFNARKRPQLYQCMGGVLHQ